jgi:hypothetical protein
LGLVLLWRHPNRGFLLTPSSIAIHLAAVAFPLIWNYAIARDSIFGPMVAGTLFQIKSTNVPNAASYAMLFVRYPFRTIWYLFPTSAIVIYCLAWRKIPSAALRENSMLIAVFTVALNLVPYWLSPMSGTRYLMPIYPLFALIMAQFRQGHCRTIRARPHRDRRHCVCGGAPRISALRALHSRQLRSGRASDHRARRQLSDLC